jgi:phosphoglycolate phosphatase-like HAD superfamily hydrolase
LYIFDWNGTLQDDLNHIYECGVQRIFRHFGLVCPDIDTYRNQVTGDFMNSFYWPHGIPKEVTAEDLNLIMKEGFKEKGDPPLFPEATMVVRGLWRQGHVVTVVSAYDAAKLVVTARQHGLSDYLSDVRGNIRDKAPVFRELMERHDKAGDSTVCVGDMVQDAEAAVACGAQAVSVPHGFHTRERLERSGVSMRLISRLSELLDSGG